jgi:hypothetical protein
VFGGCTDLITAYRIYQSMDPLKEETISGDKKRKVKQMQGCKERGAGILAILF